MAEMVFVAAALRQRWCRVLQFEDAHVAHAEPWVEDRTCTSLRKNQVLRMGWIVVRPRSASQILGNRSFSFLESANPRKGPRPGVVLSKGIHRPSPKPSVGVEHITLSDGGSLDP